MGPDAPAEGARIATDGMARRRARTIERARKGSLPKTLRLDLKT
jgi:hypothetical protein